MSLVCRRFSAVGACLMCATLMASRPVWGQSGTAASSPPVSQAELDAKIRVLTDSLDQTRAELSQSRQEIKELRGLLLQVMDRMNANVAVPGAGAPPTEVPSAQPAQARVAQVSGEEQAHITADDWQIVNARIDEMAQDKVESNLKYRLKISGIVLFNAFSNSGRVDNVDVPTIALQHSPAAPSGAVGASLRQSIIGLTGIGPEILGAETMGDIQADFFGGLPSGYAANTSGLVRLRVARLRMNWSHTSLFGGIDAPFFSPNVPSSYMSVAIPGFASAGNLWTWTPTVGLEQRIDAGATQLKIQGGLMDPPTYQGATQAERFPSGTEASRQPTYALRLSVNDRDEHQPLAFGVSEIYSPQRFAGGARVHGWGIVGDWRFPLFPHAELSGAAFAGKGLDPFGAVPTPVPPAGDYNYYAVAIPALERITAAGGWTQLKIKLDAKSEFNFGLGIGGREAEYFRQAQPLDSSLATLSPRNEMLFVNYIFRPRSDLVFSPEFRRLRTYPASGLPAIADQVGVAAGFIF